MQLLYANLDGEHSVVRRQQLLSGELVHAGGSNRGELTQLLAVYGYKVSFICYECDRLSRNFSTQSRGWLNIVTTWIKQDNVEFGV